MFARRWWKGKGAPAAPALSLALQGGGAHGIELAAPRIDREAHGLARLGAAGGVEPPAVGAQGERHHLAADRHALYLRERAPCRVEVQDGDVAAFRVGDVDAEHAQNTGWPVISVGSQVEKAGT